MDLELIKECEAKARQWLASPVYDEETKAEIRAMLENEDKSLRFRINTYVNIYKEEFFNRLSKIKRLFIK